MGDCPSQDILDQFLAGELGEQEQQQVQAHLDRCERCRRLAAANQATILDPKMAKRPLGSGAPMPEPSRFFSEGAMAGLQLDILLENYQILEGLPRGGQALVYEAIHKPTKMRVAIKVLLPTLLGSAKARLAFEREVELAASLDRPNIVRIYDSGVSRGQYYFSMEYIRGRPLDEYVQSKAMPFRDKVILFTKICDAVAYAHQHGIIHRDLKPSNILVDERGQPHILDFGLAKVAGASGILSEGAMSTSLTGEIKGSVTYMSLEQAQGRSDLVDVRSDVYSLGVILYHLLTGRFPYDVSGPMVKVLENIIHAEPVRPRQIVRRFDSDMEAIILKCLAKERSHRYQSAAELLHDLNCWLQGLPIVIRSVSSLYLLRKIVQRHKYTSLVVTLLVVIVIGFATVSYELYRAARATDRYDRQGVGAGGGKAIAAESGDDLPTVLGDTRCRTAGPGQVDRGLSGK
ncbi:MAG: protein kinase [Sedimentisphaerales bacterium]|nr:protein kinase [Sedimentisphaerales bacterium]